MEKQYTLSDMRRMYHLGAIYGCSHLQGTFEHLEELKDCHITENKFKKEVKNLEISKDVKTC